MGLDSSCPQAHDRMQAFGSGLLQLGLKPEQKTNFGIFAQNRPQVQCFILCVCGVVWCGVCLFVRAFVCSFVRVNLHLLSSSSHV